MREGRTSSIAISKRSRRSFLPLTSDERRNASDSGKTIFISIHYIDHITKVLNLLYQDAAVRSRVVVYASALRAPEKSGEAKTDNDKPRRDPFLSFRFFEDIASAPRRPSREIKDRRRFRDFLNTHTLSRCVIAGQPASFVPRRATCGRTTKRKRGV